MATVELLPLLSRTLAGIPALVVGTYRIDEVAHRPIVHAIAELRRQRLCEEIALGALERAQVQTMVEEILGSGRHAETVQEIHADVLDERAAEIASHFAAAEQADEARRFGERAAARASALGAPADALGHLRRALEFTEDPRDRAATLLAIGNLSYAVGDFRKAVAQMREAAERYEALGERRLYAHALLDLWWATHMEADSAGALSILESHSRHCVSGRRSSSSAVAPNAYGASRRVVRRRALSFRHSAAPTSLTCVFTRWVLSGTLRVL